MPKYLANHSVRLLEASLESLSLAIMGLGMPQRTILRTPATRYSPVIGLVGAAAEQVLASILIQVKGEQALMNSMTQFKSARQILDEVRGLLRTPVPRMSFLTSGLENPANHRDEIVNATNMFSLLFTERAAGLHGGKGPSREVVLAAIVRVHEFISLLAKSNRIRAYIDSIPQAPGAPPEIQVLVEDLVNRFRNADDSSDRATILRSLFLVFPETPQIEPEWLAAFDRTAVAPTEDDINLLLTTLEHAAPVRLRRINEDGQALGVVVRPNDPAALPIAAHHLRRAFATIPDQWAADVGMANGRLEQGTLDLPHGEFILDLCLLGPDQIAHALPRERLTAHEAWPFIAAALLQPGSGTPKPFWFLTSLVEDIGQLIAQLNRASAASTHATFHRRVAETVSALESYRRQQPLRNTFSLAAEVRAAVTSASIKLDNLTNLGLRNWNTERAVSDEGIMLLSQLSDGTMSVGDAYQGIVHGLSPASQSYWARLLAEAASEPGDKVVLIQVIREPALQPAHTAARKALRLADILEFGPHIELD